MTREEWLDRLVKDQEYRLKQAEDAWDRCVATIRDNPNQLNVRGIWLGDFLAEMEQIRVAVREREMALINTRRLIAELGEDKA